MCGIAGMLAPDSSAAPDLAEVRAMLSMLAHRGPDETGIYLDRRVGLANARLSVIDPPGGTQPIGNEDGTVWVTFNGELYDHASLRRDLEDAGHRFETRTDTEVLVHLYEELGHRCVERLNGQFAFAVWDRRARRRPRLVLGRDRLGIRPLFYTAANARLLFASEVKALFAHPDVARRFDAVGLHQLLTLWSTIGDRTAYDGVRQLPPGHVLIAEDSAVRVERYWDLDFSERIDGGDAEAIEEFASELDAAVGRRLVADVPIGSYLSGGLDSSSVTALATHRTRTLRTYSIGFTDPRFDESAAQQLVSQTLGTDHLHLTCTTSEVAASFRDAVWHAEAPLLRTAPVPLYLLSRLVRDDGVKVVLTGEGADEILAGYQIFKEDRLRRFWARVPESTCRPRLLELLYPYLDQSVGSEFLSRFYGRHLTDTGRLTYSHDIRWANTGHLRRLLHPDVGGADYDPAEDVAQRLADHSRFQEWSPLARAQYLEASLFLPGYLLSSQGDRMLMAHSVEGRFPFLDHRLVELASRLPDRMKLRGLKEKVVLKEAMRGALPDEVIRRPKQPYRAPVEGLLDAPDGYHHELLSPQAVAAAGLFRPAGVKALTAKADGARPMSERDGMALVAVLSMMVLHDRLITGSSRGSTSPAEPSKIVIGEELHA